MKMLSIKMVGFSAFLGISIMTLSINAQNETEDPLFINENTDICDHSDEIIVSRDGQDDQILVGFEDEDDMDLPNLEDIRAWEKKNPPSFFKVTGAFITDHIKKNPLLYAAGLSAFVGLGYYFRNHLLRNKYRYLLGSTLTAGLAVWYAKNEFDRYMNQTKAVTDDVLCEDVK